MARVLTLDDIRFNRYAYRVTAAPPWAYAPDQWRSPQPIPELWAGVMAELQALAKAEYVAALKADFQRRAELKRRIDAGTASADEKIVFATAHLFGPRLDVPRMLYYPNKQQRCWICGEMFFATWPTRYCSRRCLRARWRRRWRRSRAKVPDDLRCGRCGGSFTPTRSDARYCSLRCRVAAHRARRKEAPSAK
jgi:hypothetical protein